MEGWCKQKERENVLFVKYEDMIHNFKHETKRMADFLDLEVSEQLLNKVCEFASFEAMQKNQATNASWIMKGGFIRKEQIGQWKDYFTVAQNEWFDDMYRERLEKAGIQLQFE